MEVQNKTHVSAMHPYFQIPNVDSGLISLNPHGVVQSTEICRKSGLSSVKNKQQLS